jgi:hypothetical protein
VVCERLEILHDGRKAELVTGAGETSKTHALEAMVDLERIDREPFALDEPRIHARFDHRLKKLSKDVAVTEAAVAIDRECRVMGHRVIESEATEPTIGEARPPRIACARNGCRNNSRR